MHLETFRNVLKKSSTEAQRLKIDAIPNIIRAYHFLSKIAWALLLLAAAATCVWFIVKSVNRYSSYGVVTTTRSFEEVRSVFPTLAICSMNPMSSRYAIELIQSANLSYTPNATTVASGTAEYNFGLLLDLQEFMRRTRGRYLNLQEKRLLSFDLDTSLIGCFYEFQQCNSSLFEWFFNPFYMGCYRFNAQGEYSAMVPGRNNQLFVQVIHSKFYDNRQFVFSFLTFLICL